MRIGVVGPGRIGGNVARQAARAGHEVVVSHSRDEGRLRALADELGGRAGTAAEATSATDLVVLAVPWSVLPDAITTMGDVAGRVVVDTTNQYGAGPMPADGQTAAAFNAARLPGARYVKTFNTLTAAFQEQTAHLRGAERVVQWLCGDDAEAKQVVAAFVADCGYAPVDLGGTATSAPMEPPRRPGAVYGEGYREPEAAAVAEAVRAGRAVPPPASA